MIFVKKCYGCDVATVATANTCAPHSLFPRSLLLSGLFGVLRRCDGCDCKHVWHLPGPDSPGEGEQLEDQTHVGSTHTIQHSPPTSRY